MAIASRSISTELLVSIEPDCEGVDNMCRDVAMAHACIADGRARLRLYSWNPWALSLGYNQPDDNVNRALLDEHGWQLVRRPTGGRAVFHAEEITYAVAMRGNGRGIHQTYADIMDGIRAGLEWLGAGDLEFSRSRPDFRKHYELPESASCFSASALNELTWHDRKLVGSAQRRYDDVLLQHGSILLGDAHLAVVDLLHGGASRERRELLRGRLAERTTTLHNILGGDLPSFGVIAASLARAFEDRGICSS